MQFHFFTYKIKIVNNILPNFFCNSWSTCWLSLWMTTRTWIHWSIFQQSFAVREVALHEDYDSFNINNDICMLKLDGTITWGFLSHVDVYCNLQRSDQDELTLNVRSLACFVSHSHLIWRQLIMGWRARKSRAKKIKFKYSMLGGAIVVSLTTFSILNSFWFQRGPKRRTNHLAW